MLAYSIGPAAFTGLNVASGKSVCDHTYEKGLISVIYKEFLQRDRTAAKPKEIIQLINGHTEGQELPEKAPTIRKMQLRTQARCLLTPVRMAETIKGKRANAGGDVEERECSGLLGGSGNRLSYYGKQCGSFSKRIKNKSTL